MSCHLSRCAIPALRDKRLAQVPWRGTGGEGRGGGLPGRQVRPYAPARQREIARHRWGTLPQRGPEPPPPRATPGRDGELFPTSGRPPFPIGETFPIDARTRGAGAERPATLGNGSPTSPGDARGVGRAVRRQSTEVLSATASRSHRERPASASRRCTLTGVSLVNPGGQVSSTRHSRRRCYRWVGAAAVEEVLGPFYTYGLISKVLFVIVSRC